MAGSGAMTPRTFQIVVAAAKQLGIGKGGSLPWKLPPDMAFFKELTSATADSTRANAVIMGRCVLAGRLCLCTLVCERCR